MDVYSLFVGSVYLYKKKKKNIANYWSGNIKADSGEVVHVWRLY